MNIRKVVSVPTKGKSVVVDAWDHFVALDWSMKVMAVAQLGRRSAEPKVFQRPANLKELKAYLSLLKGRVIVAFEETSSAHWLYVELLDCVERIVVCNPWNNRLLSSGPKTDKIDAGKLCLLLRSGLLKEVFHSTDALYELRTLVSSYDDLVKAGVRLLNQRHALVEQGHRDQQHHVQFILEHLDQNIERYRQTKEQYEAKFKSFCRRHSTARRLLAVEGLGAIGVAKILAIVVDAHRFGTKGQYLSYCGLVYNEKLSGGRSYGRRKPRYCHGLKAVYKTAAMAALHAASNPIREYYDYLLANGIAEHNARHAVARRIATTTYAMLKHGTVYEPNRWRMSIPTLSIA